MHHVLELFPVWSKVQGSRASPLLTRGAIEEEDLVRGGECWSWWLWHTTIRPPWVAQWWRPIRYKISEHLTLNRMARNKIQLNLSQLCSPLSDIASRIGVVEHGSQWV
jgi:hypothetical protein